MPRGRLTPGVHMFRFAFGFGFGFGFAFEIGFREYQLQVASVPSSKLQHDTLEFELPAPFLLSSNSICDIMIPNGERCEIEDAALVLTSGTGWSPTSTQVYIAGISH